MKKITLKKISRVRLIESAFAVLFGLILLSVGQPTSAETLTGNGIMALFFGDHAEVTLVTETALLEERAQKIDAFYSQEKFGAPLPLAGHGKKLVLAAEKYGVEWNLLPAIAFLESTAGKNRCNGYNDYGWYSCKKHFSSVTDAAHHVAWNLGGHNPRTAYFYAGKTVPEILNAYNPPQTPGIRPDYHYHVLNTMEQIDAMEV